MIAIAIVGILASLAAPSFSEMIKNNRLSTKTNNIVTAINTARQTSISRNLVTMLCHSNNAEVTAPSCNGGSSSDWNKGMLVYATKTREILNAKRAYTNGDTLLKQIDLDENDHITVTNTNAANFIAFRSNGLLFDTATAITFLICDDRTGETGRTVRISTAGRISTEDTVCT